MTIEDTSYNGPANIAKGLQDFLFVDGRPKFQQLKHQPTKIDAQPSQNGGIVVFVTGHMIVRPRAPAPLLHCVAGSGVMAASSIFVCC